ncbi:MAG TPA: zinc-ribbon domain-containing protein, partial [Candidatus Poseidoniales archaeon]|nr:zinc-ribbon domain-containing protein [Candidatus Poseidoniales archaeon]
MVFCSSCGSELADGWVACPNCGAGAGEQSTLVGTPTPQFQMENLTKMHIVSKGNQTDSGYIIIGI